MCIRKMIGFVLSVLFMISVCLFGEDNLIFYASYDNGVNADKSIGLAGGIPSGDLILEEGIKGKGVVVGVGDGKGYWVKYNAENNINIKEGTISLWVKPIDWDGNDGYFHLIFEAIDKDSRLIIYKYFGTDKLYFFFDSPKGNKTISEISIKDWKRGDWHHVACSWDSKIMKLYIDGELVDTQEKKEFMSTSFSSFAVGGFNPQNWKNPQGKSVIDELKIYSVVVDSKEIYKEWEEGIKQQKRERKTGSDISHLIGVKKADKSPILDGKIEEQEYTFKGTGFIEIGVRVYSNLQSTYYLTYDSDNLYIGVVSPVIGPLYSKIKGRDDRVWEDDVIEVFLNPDIETKDYYHFIINSIGTLYDEKNDNSNWNIGNLPFINRVDKDTWTIEMAIPFKEIGVKSPKEGENWKINICRSFASSSGTFTSLSPVKGAYKDVNSFFCLKFLNESPIVKIERIGSLSSGNLELDFAVDNKTSSSDIVKVVVNLEAEGKDILNYEKEFQLEKGKEIRVPLSKKDFKGKGTFKVDITSSTKGKIYTTTIPFTTEKLFQFEYLSTIPDKGVLKVGLKQIELTRFGNPFIVKVCLLDKENKRVVEKSYVPEKINYEVELDISQIAPGDYKVEMSLICPDGKLITTLKEDYTKLPSPSPWYNNKIGITDKVPSPWTPMEVTRDSVKCWGREYVFNNSLFPTQITSQKKKLLTRPIKLVVLRDGIEEEVSGVKTVWEEKKENKVKLLNKGKVGTINLSTDVLMEYDGFMWIKMNLEPVSPTKIDKIILEVPLNREYATLLNSGDYYLRGTGAIPKEGWNKNLKTKPIFWVGNEDVGVQWFAQDLKGWYVKDSSHSAEVIPQGDEVIVRLNIIDTPITLSQGREISFGFQSTPVKPKPVGWRKWKVGGETAGANPNLNLWCLPFQWVSYPDATKLYEPEVNRWKELKSRWGEQVCVYIAFAYATALSPEWKYYGETWMKKPQSRIPKRNVYISYVPCLNSEDYRNFYIWKLNKAIHDLNFEGLYIDGGHVVFCTNPLHGCGWEDAEGSLYSTYNILGTREMAKRIYVIMKEYNPNSIIGIHASGEIAMPVHSFCDIFIDGENLTEMVADEESYYNLSLDKFRAEHISSNWGFISLFLPEFTRSAELLRPERMSFWKTEEGRKRVLHFLGLIAVHDAHFWYNWFPNYEDPLKVIQIRDEFGWDDEVEFFPYWNNSEYIKILEGGKDNVVVSIFKRHGKIMLVPFNNTDEDVKLKLFVNLEKLNFPKRQEILVVDKFSGEEFKIKDNILDIPVEKRMFRMLVIEDETRATMGSVQ